MHREAAKAETVGGVAGPMVQEQEQEQELAGAGDPARPAECPAAADHPHLAYPDTARPPKSPA